MNISKDKIIKYLENQKAINELTTINGTRYIKDIEWHKIINKTLQFLENK